ncbi:glycosyltransferase [Candidatus Saccharibacteria bacterium]|nr:glycosyltransferase [Candidatus Saccharibacteria bacterium]
MKIAFFSDCYLDLTGGIVTAINLEKTELERRGHTVYVFSSSYPHSEEEIKKLAREHIYPVPSCKVFGRKLTPIARRPGVVEKWLRKNHPELQGFDIFYVHYEAGCSIAGLRLAKAFKIPSIQVMHGREDMGEATLIPFGLRTMVAVLLNWFHSWYLPHSVKVKRDNYLATTIAKAKMWTLMANHANFADLVVTPSEHFRKKLIHYGVKRQIIALHHGLSDDSFKKHPNPKSLHSGETLEIIWHSRVSSEKRIIPFLQALAIVKNGYHLSVYGDGVDFNKARRFAKKHHLNVTFFGNTNFQTIKKNLAKSHLDVLVSYNYDTFGITLIEAEADAVPVFLVDPDLTEVLVSGEYILASGPEPQQMADAITKIIEKPEIIEKISQKMLSHYGESTTSRKIGEFEKIAKTLL